MMILSHAVVLLGFFTLDPTWLRSPAELQSQLEQPDLRILDTRPFGEYKRGHLPGAVWVDVRKAEALAARPGGLSDLAAWDEWLQPLAISPQTHVVVIDGKKQLDAARVWWLLCYLGVPDAGMLDGNYPLWEREARPTSKDIPETRPGTFHAHFEPGWLATRDDVAAGLKSGARIVDARSAEEYNGTRKMSKKAGHIPAACPLDWVNFVDADGRFLEEKAVEAKIAKAGIKPGEAVITHCQGGGRAAVDAFVFRRLGYPAKNYYLGWSDWGNADEAPVEKP